MRVNLCQDAGQSILILNKTAAIFRVQFSDYGFLYFMERCDS